MKSYNWTTARGAKVEMTVEVKTITEALSDMMERERKIKNVAEVRVNGNIVDNPRFSANGEDILFSIGGRNAETEIPKETRELVWEEEREAVRARDAAEARAEESYRDHHNKIRRAMAE